MRSRVAWGRAVALATALLIVIAALVGRATGASLFRGDLEARGGGWQSLGWDDLQHERDRPTSDSFALVKTPVRQGGSAAKIIVRQGYSQFGHNEDTELVWQSGEQPGQDFYYAWSTLFPTDWRAPYKWGIFAQWHATLGTSPAVSFGARGDTASVSVLAGQTNERENTFAYSEKYEILSSLSKGRWNDFVLRVRWSAKSDGLVEVWHRVAGSGSFAKKLSVTSIPTLQYDPARGQSAGAPASIYILWGLYRASYCSKPTQLNCQSSLGVQPDSVLYQDGFVRGSSFNDVVQAAFGSGSGTTTEAPSAPPAAPANPPAAPTGSVPGSTATPPSGSGPAPAPAPPPIAPRPGRQETLASPNGPWRRLLLQRASTVLGPQCSGCSVFAVGGPETRVTIASGADGQDAAYRVMRPAGLSGLGGPTTTRLWLRLAPGKRPSENVAVFQAYDAQDRLVYELYIARNRTLRLWSPAGGLRATPVNESTGVRVPNDGRSKVSVKTTVLPDDSVLVRANDVPRIRIGKLRGRQTGPLASFRVGIHHYDSAAAADPLELYYSRLALFSRAGRTLSG